MAALRALLWALSRTFSATSSVMARSSDTLLGAANTRSKPCTLSLVNARPVAPLGAVPCADQPPRRVRPSKPAVKRRPVQAGGLTDRGAVTDDHPCRDASIPV